MENIKRLLPLLSLLISSALLFSTCDVSNSGQTGTIEVKMVDAPGDFQAVAVDIQRIRIHQSETAEMDSSASDEEAANNGWVTVMDESAVINLLTLRNGNEVTLGNTELEAGTYTQLRLILGNENEVVVDGQPFELTIPDQPQSGIKLDINATIKEGQNHIMLIDFDVARSIVQNETGGYTLKPVFRAVNLNETGSIAGVVNPTDFQTYIHAIAGEDTLSTIADDEGQYMIMGAAPATYELVFNPNSEQYSDSTVRGIEVITGETTNIDTLNFE